MDIDARLRGKRVLITGGGSGLGRSMAARLVAAGARVGICGRRADKLERTLAELDPEGERLWAQPCDVRDPTAVDAWIEAAWARWGGVDALINNAAGNFLAATEDLSPHGFDAVVRIVLHGTFHATQAVGKRWIAAGRGGQILNIVATYAWTGSAFVVPSGAAKAGVLAMTRSLAVEWATYGIRLNAIAPGPFPTEGAWAALLPTPELEEEARRRVPLGRFGRHEELAELVAFLLSDAAAFITGECIVIDGGAWLASGGTFNALAQRPRAELKALLRRLREG